MKEGGGEHNIHEYKMPHYENKMYILPKLNVRGICEIFYI